MSTKSLADQDRVPRKSTQRRNNSGELDVFEATRYFSGSNEAVGYNKVHFSTMREEKRRMSLDMPTAHLNSLPAQTHQSSKEIKKSKQPSSPGGKLARFLNTLFQQAKKKSKSMKDEEESPGGRRRRRSSISLFHIVNSNDSKSMYGSSTGSGFRTPPPPTYVDTPTKGYRDDHKHIVSLPKYNAKVKSVLSSHDEKKNMDLAWLDEKLKFIEKNKNTTLTNLDKFSSEKKINVKRGAEVEVDDGGESDSSSDLFELENYDLGDYSSDLPVYETTNVESIKRGAPL